MNGNMNANVNSKKPITINQPAGVGDIMFLEPIFRMLSKTRHVVVPVVDQYMWIQKHIPYVEFRPYRQEFENLPQEFTDDYLPFRFANPILRGYDLHDWHDMENCMLDKYRIMGLPETMWLDLQLVRDHENEQRLFELHGSPEKFILVNEFSRAGDIQINIETDLPVIKMREIEGFSVVDWCLMMERATENHHVQTSTLYPLHMLGVDAKIYPKPDVDGMRGILDLLAMTKMVAG